MNAKELAEKIIKELAQENVPEYCSKWIESLLAAALEEAQIDFGVKVTGDMHKDLYEQAGEIEKLERELKESKAAAYAEGKKYGEQIVIDLVGLTKKEAYEDCAKIVENAYMLTATESLTEVAAAIRAKAAEVGK